MALSFTATAAFERDFDSILAYLTYELASPQTAMKLMDAVGESIERIRENPKIDHISTKPTLEQLEYHEEFVRGYVMLYKIEDGGIVAKRMFHHSQDYESYV